MTGRPDVTYRPQLFFVVALIGLLSAILWIPAGTQLLSLSILVAIGCVLVVEKRLKRPAPTLEGDISHLVAHSFAKPPRLGDRMVRLFIIKY